MRILCVDDDDDTRVLLEQLLGAAGFETICVKDAASARRLIEVERFSLYIIDEELPGESGLRLCEQIRKRDEKVPIIIFSGHGFPADREAGLLAGANLYLLKPYSGELVQAIRRLIEDAESSTRER